MNIGTERGMQRVCTRSTYSICRVHRCKSPTVPNAHLFLDNIFNIFSSCHEVIITFFHSETTHFAKMAIIWCVFAGYITLVPGCGRQFTDERNTNTSRTTQACLNAWISWLCCTQYAFSLQKSLVSCLPWESEHYIYLTRFFVTRSCRDFHWSLLI